MVALIAVLIIVSVQFVGSQMECTYEDVNVGLSQDTSRECVEQVDPITGQKKKPRKKPKPAPPP